MEPHLTPARLLNGNYGLIVAAPTVKSPAYEKQMDLLRPEIPRLADNGVVLIQILEKGQSTVGGESLADDLSDALLRIMGTSCERFCVALISPSGEVLFKTDAPMLAGAIYGHLEQAAS